MFMLRKMTCIAFALSRWTKPTIAMPLGARAFSSSSSRRSATVESGPRRLGRDVGTTLDRSSCRDRSSSSSAIAARRRWNGSSALRGGIGDGGDDDDHLVATTTYATNEKSSSSLDSGREKRKKFIGLAKAVDRGQFQNAYNPGGLDGTSFVARSGLPNDKKLFCVLGIESSCDDTGGELDLIRIADHLVYT